MSTQAPARPLLRWYGAVERALERHAALVRVTLATVRGSAPREAGATMLVTPGDIEGTIGGGRLEWDAAAAARRMLGAGPVAGCRKVVLGAELGQCCGGVVELWFERFGPEDRATLRRACLASQAGPAVLVSVLSPSGPERRIVSAPGEDARADRLLEMPRARAAPLLRRSAGGDITLIERLDSSAAPVWLYGAGHVGQALARILGELPLELSWIDPRAQQFPSQGPEGVRIIESADPVQTVGAAPAGARFLVMTHSHALDFAICRAILERGDFAWVGLIGSKSKSASFRSRLRREGVERAAIARLVCPIGIAGISDKCPAAIAVAVAAQLLQHLSGEVVDGTPAPPQPAGADCAQGDCTRCGAHPAQTA